MHIDINALILVGVLTQLAGSVAKTVFKKPAQQAQIDRIEAGVNNTLAQVAPVLSALKSPDLKSPAAAPATDTTKGTPAP